jgi:hypothetical protein
MVFYAQWLDSSTPQYTITFNANGATSGAPPESQTVYSGISITIPNQGTLLYSGKTFNSWNTAANGSGVTHGVGDILMITTNLTLFAQWSNTPAEDAHTYTANSSQTFIEAIAAINASSNAGDYIITVSGSFSTPSVTFTANAMKTITLQGTATNCTIYNSSSDPFFSVPNRITLSLGNNITLNGNQKYYPAVKVLTGGSLNMNDGAAITGANARGVWVNGGTFNMDGGSINNNYSGNDMNGGGVYINNNGTFNLSNGIISDNEGNRDGGGVCVENGTFNMTGGEIKSNTGGDNTSSYSSGGGAVYISGNGVFYMSDGIISYNTAQSSYGAYGGGVLVGISGSEIGIFTMLGGSITGNTVSADSGGTYGGGVYVSTGSSFAKIGGTIDDTNSADYGKVAYVSDGGKVRNTTSGPSDNMDSSIAGAAGGWESVP